MPFKSEAQRRWMHANKPEMAKKWEKHTPKGKKLPKKKQRSEGKMPLSSKLDEIFFEDEWVQGAAKKIEKKGTEGAFTKQAAAAGYDDPMKYARHVKANSDKFDKKTVQRAMFALNANK